MTPDLGQLGLLVLAGVPVAVLVTQPYWPRASTPQVGDPDLEALALRRRIAYDAIRDLDVDYHAGNVPIRQYLRSREHLELRAAAALAELESAMHGSIGETAAVADVRRWRKGRRKAAGLGLILALGLLVGFGLPEPLSLANGTVVNRALADSLALEEARLAEIERLQSELRSDEIPSRQLLSSLADAYLAGASGDDLVKAAWLLLALVQLAPEDEDAHARLITAYVRAGDYGNASKATDALQSIAPESVDVPFFRGLIALRGLGDPLAAIAAFDEFLRSAPDDARASMVRNLRAQAAGEASPGAVEWER